MTRAGRIELSMLAGMLMLGMMLVMVEDWRFSRRAVQASTFDHGVRPMVLDVNTSHWAWLQQIDGVGYATARAIAAERERGGEFASEEDLAARVDGVGPATAARVWIEAGPRD